MKAREALFAVADADSCKPAICAANTEGVPGDVPDGFRLMATPRPVPPLPVAATVKAVVIVAPPPTVKVPPALGKAASAVVP